MEMIPTALPEITAALCSYLCIFCLNCPWPPVSEGSRVYRLGTVNWIDAVYETLGKSSFIQDEDFSVLLKFFLVCLLEITMNSLTSEGVNFVGIWFIIGTIYLKNICLYLSRKAILNWQWLSVRISILQWCTIAKSRLGKEGFICFSLPLLLFITKGSRDRNSNKAGS